MKYLRQLSLWTLVVLLFSTTFASCDDDDDDMEEMTIAQLASSDSRLSTLVSALDRASLVSTFENQGSFTVFAPTNDAFQSLLNSNPSWNTLEDIPVATLDLVLKYHVLSAEVMSSDLSDSYVTTLAQGPNSEAITLQIDVTGGIQFNGSADPVDVDIKASNGIIHIIDEVMLPPNIVDIALKNSNFSILVEALTDSRHTLDFVATLSAAGPYTVFAPTNDAFIALLDSNPAWNALSDIDISTLEAVLLYHVVDGANVQSDQLTDDQTINMIGGGTAQVDLSSGAKLETTSGQSVDIIITDVQGTNGVVHAIDAVLLP